MLHSLAGSGGSAKLPVGRASGGQQDPPERLAALYVRMGRGRFGEGKYLVDDDTKLPAGYGLEQSLDHGVGPWGHQELDA